MALGLRLGSWVRVKVRVGVSIRVWVIVLFCRSIVLSLVFYAFRTYIPHSALYRYRRNTHCCQHLASESRCSLKQLRFSRQVVGDLQLVWALVVCEYVGMATEAAWHSG